MSLRRWSSLVAVAVAVAMGWVTCVEAQQRGRGGLGFAPGGDVLMLLSQEAVQKELKLTDAQKTTAREAGDELRSFFADMRDASQEERRAARDKAESKIKELRGKVEGTLDAAQKDRLKQLSIQRRGAFGALQDPEVATALKLTDEQKKKVETLAEESRPGRGQGGGGGGGGDRAALRERFAAMQKERNEKALAILTAEQKAELEKLQGPKFEFPARGGFGA